MIAWNADVEWLVADMLDAPQGFGECRQAAVVDKDGQLLAAVLFHNWQPKDGVVEVSAAALSPRWATRAHLGELFGYAFAIAQLCAARIHEDNHRARRLWRSFGAQEIILPRMRGRTASEALYLLTDDAWRSSRYMRKRHGKAQVPAPA